MAYLKILKITLIIFIIGIQMTFCFELTQKNKELYVSRNNSANYSKI